VRARSTPFFAYLFVRDPGAQAQSQPIQRASGEPPIRIQGAADRLSIVSPDYPSSTDGVANTGAEPRRRGGCERGMGVSSLPFGSLRRCLDRCNQAVSPPNFDAVPSRD
jgi:hypothetical protein